VIERLLDLRSGELEILLVDSQTLGSTIVRRLVDDWTSGTNRFARPGEALFGSRLDGQLIGVCGLNLDPYAGDDRIGRVRHLYVCSAQRGRGVGRALVTQVLGAARGRFDELRLRTNNPVAARLYEGLAFLPCDVATGSTHTLALRSGGGDEV
jgi:GNAT superfamily N-acetyltransferase